MTERVSPGSDEPVITRPEELVPGTAIKRRDAVTVALEACVIIKGAGASLPPKVIEIFDEAKGGTLGATPDQLTAAEQFMEPRPTANMGLDDQAQAYTISD